jgi:hypothetical protein
MDSMVVRHRKACEPETIFEPEVVVQEFKDFCETKNMICVCVVPYKLFDVKIVPYPRPKDDFITAYTRQIDEATAKLDAFTIADPSPILSYQSPAITGSGQTITYH